jgi:DNA processing protein
MGAAPTRAAPESVHPDDEQAWARAGRPERPGTGPGRLPSEEPENVLDPAPTTDPPDRPADLGDPDLDRADPDGADPDGGSFIDPDHRPAVVVARSEVEAGGRSGPPVDPEVLLARAYLSRVAEPPAPALVALVAEVGPVEAADRVRAGKVAERVAAETSSRRAIDRAAADLDAAAAAGMRLICPEHPEWPTEMVLAFAAADEPALTEPLALWVRGPGRLDALCAHAVAVVGSRAATRYGTTIAGELGSGIAGQGWTVVSGAAIGIDGAAHRGALAVGGATVAVLACGADRAYPAAHQALLERIVATGLVVSEYPPGCVPGRHRFLVRNRIIAGLTTGTVVVEAGLRSGAHRTATDALTLGRDVLAVPGPVTSATSAGCHRLIRDGAVLVTRTDEVLEGVSRIGADLAAPPVGATRRPTDGLSAVALLVHDALPTRVAREIGWLALEAGLPVSAVRAALVDLERRGLVGQFGGRWQRTSPKAR